MSAVKLGDVRSGRDIGCAYLEVGEVEAEAERCKQECRDLAVSYLITSLQPKLTSRYERKSRTGLDSSMTNYH